GGSSRGGRGRRRRRAGSRARRSREGLGRPASRYGCHRRRAPRVLPRAAGRLQSAGDGRVQNRTAEDNGRQGHAPGAQGGRMIRRMRLRLGLGWMAGTVAIAAIAAEASTRARAVEADKYAVYAVRFATITGFPVSSLVAGAERGRRIDL